MNTINELDAVVLACDLPEHGLARGDVGTAVLVHGGGAAFEVEFVAHDVSAKELTRTVRSDSLRPN